jgi:hypothetical protein
MDEKELMERIGMSASAIRFARTQASAAERAKVVAFLRKNADTIKQAEKAYGERGIWHLASHYARQSDYFARTADAIEALTHHEGE